MLSIVRTNKGRMLALGILTICSFLCTSCRIFYVFLVPDEIRGMDGPELVSLKAVEAQRLQLDDGHAIAQFIEAFYIPRFIYVHVRVSVSGEAFDVVSANSQETITVNSVHAFPAHPQPKASRPTQPSLTSTDTQPFAALLYTKDHGIYVCGELCREFASLSYRNRIIETIDNLREQLELVLDLDQLQSMDDGFRISGSSGHIALVFMLPSSWRLPLYLTIDYNIDKIGYKHAFLLDE